MKEFNTTTGELFVLHAGLCEADIMNKNFSRKGGLSVYRNMAKMEDELKTYVDEKNKLVNEYKDEDKNGIAPGDKGWDKFVEELSQIGSIDVKIEVNTITVDDLPDNVTPAFIGLLNFMIE